MNETIAILVCAFILSTIAAMLINELLRRPKCDHGTASEVARFAESDLYYYKPDIDKHMHMLHFGPTPLPIAVRHVFARKCAVKIQCPYCSFNKWEKQEEQINLGFCVYDRDSAMKWFAFVEKHPDYKTRGFTKKELGL